MPRARLEGLSHLALNLPVGFRLHDANAVASAWLRTRLIVIGLIVGFAVIAAATGIGTSIFSIVWDSTFGSASGINNVVQDSTPLILAGCAVAIGRQVRLWNIGVDGQLYLGAWAAYAVAFKLPSLPAELIIPLALLASIVAGAGMILIPSLLRAYLGVNEIITTLMFTFVGPLWVAYWAIGPWAGSGYLHITTANIPEQSELPQVGLGPLNIGVGFIIATAVCVAAWAAFRYARSGFRARLVGSDEVTARYAGINVRRTQLIVFLLSGGVGGLLGGVIMMDQIHQLSLGLSSITGFLGIVVAVLALASPLVCLPMGMILGATTAATLGLSIAGVSPDVVLFLFGLLIALGGLADVLARYRFEPALLSTLRRKLTNGDL